jgi:(1->4)-alpha-D-glucan 1-alpha-D-glucosylmutase
MLATATHDTKRGEDARARIHVLSEMPETWSQAAARWAELNIRHKTESGGRVAPSANDEYLIYQTLAGVWPVEDAPDLENLHIRLGEFMTKALREAKQESSWDNPDTDYEAGVLKFLERIFDPNFGAAFLRHFGAFHDLVARAGLLNSLSQLTLKLTCPGVPDLYQGAEMWDFSLVDPDNRRPVDFCARQAVLAALRRAADPGALVAEWRTGQIKAFVTHRLLMLRREMPQVFLGGGYEPLPVEGARADHIIAFKRGDDTMGAAILVGRHFTRLLTDGVVPPAQSWGDTTVKMPAVTALDALGGGVMAAQQSIAAAFRTLPVAVYAWGPPRLE